MTIDPRKFELNEIEEDAHTQAEMFFATVDDFADRRQVSPLTMLFVAAIIVNSCREQMSDMDNAEFEAIWAKFMCYLNWQDLMRQR